MDYSTNYILLAICGLLVVGIFGFYLLFTKYIRKRYTGPPIPQQEQQELIIEDLDEPIKPPLFSRHVPQELEELDATQPPFLEYHHIDYPQNEPDPFPRITHRPFVIKT